MGESKKDDKKKERSSSSWKNPKKKKPKDVNDNEPQLDKADKVKGRDNNSKTLTGNGAAGVKRDMLRELSDISMSFRLAVAPIEELVNEDKDEQREDDANSQKPTTATPTKKRRKPKTKNKVKRRAPQRLKFAPKEEEEPQQQQVGLTLELDRRDFVKSNMEISALTIENEFSKRDVLSPDSTSSDNTNVTDANTEFSWTPPKSNIDFYSSAVAPFSSQPKQSEIALSRIVSNRRLVPKEYAANPEDARLSLMSFPSVLENEWFGDFGAVDSKPEINIPAAASKNPKKTTSSDKPCTTVSPAATLAKEIP